MTWETGRWWRHRWASLQLRDGIEWRNTIRPCKSFCACKIVKINKCMCPSRIRPHRIASLSKVLCIHWSHFLFFNWPILCVCALYIINNSTYSRIRHYFATVYTHSHTLTHRRTDMSCVSTTIMNPHTKFGSPFHMWSSSYTKYRLQYTWRVR